MGLSIKNKLMTIGTANSHRIYVVVDDDIEMMDRVCFSGQLSTESVSNENSNQEIHPNYPWVEPLHY